MREKRQVRSVSSRFQTREDGERLYVSGYFAVFGSNYEVWEGATESIEPHAFDGELNKDVRCLINHETRLVLGRTKAGTLTLKVDAHGLWGEVEINKEDQDAMNLYVRVKRGDVDQCSFGFDIEEEQTDVGPGDAIHWTIKKVTLYEVSVVTFPAYEETSVSAREKDAEQIKKRKNDHWKQNMLKKLKGES